MTDTIIFTPIGFRFSALSAGIKKSGKPDLALIVSDRPADSAGVFTRNKVVAAPVVVSRETTRASKVQAVLVNAGNANACTGPQGLQDARRCRRLTAETLELEDALVAVASTGIIGVPLPMTAFENGIPKVVSQLGTQGPEDVATAIRTTDAFEKLASRELQLSGGTIRLLGIAKGAGMIHPDMGTMLAFVLTDAAVEGTVLQDMLQAEVQTSFNAITVDGDMSTNDTVLMLANGASGAAVAPGSADMETFRQALQDVLAELARMIVRDGEGATKLVTVQVRGAESQEDAVLAARAIATSSLVKTAFFGQDPNWGRIIAAAGYSGAAVDPDRVDIFFDKVPMVRQGRGEGTEREKEAAAVLQLPEFTVTVDLQLGDGTAHYYTSDLTYDYVRINAEYHT